MRLTRRTVLVAGAAFAAPARAAAPIRLGLLRTASPAPLYIAQERGWFREAGVEVVFRFFDAAQPIAAAAVAGDTDMGITDLGSFRGENDIAEQRQCGTQPHCVAVQATDQRLFHIQDRENDALGEAQFPVEVLRMLGVEVDVLDITASRKGPARPGQNDDIRVCVLGRKEDGLR